MLPTRKKSQIKRFTKVGNKKKLLSQETMVIYYFFNNSSSSIGIYVLCQFVLELMTEKATISKLVVYTYDFSM